MFTESERELLKISRAIISLHGFFIVTEENSIIDDPMVLVDLLTKVELETFKSLLNIEPLERIEIEENIVKNKFLTLLGSDQFINFSFTPAGVISFIAEAIVRKSEEYLSNEVNIPYNEAAESVNYLENMCAIISYYMNISYDFAISLPISEIYKRYAICQQAFPNQVQALSNEEE